jgi:hypothetical protein
MRKLAKKVWVRGKVSRLFVGFVYLKNRRVWKILWLIVVIVTAQWSIFILSVYKSGIMIKLLLKAQIILRVIIGNSWSVKYANIIIKVLEYYLYLYKIHIILFCDYLILI